MALQSTMTWDLLIIVYVLRLHSIIILNDQR